VTRGLIAAVILAVLVQPSVAGGVEEPLGYRMEAFRAPVPETLEGATVIDTEAARALWSAGKAVFVDVLPRPPRPATLPEGTIWRQKPRRSIPGAVWLPNVGFGALAPQTDAYFRDGLAALLDAADSPVVFFCLADCWMSWNAAKRVIEEYGYSQVYWYPGGTTEWAAAGLPLEQVEPR